MVMQLYYQMRKSTPVEKVRYVTRNVPHVIEEGTKPEPDILYTVKLGGVFEEIGGIDEEIGGGNQKVGTNNKR
jgi:hypothetical protein